MTVLDDRKEHFDKGTSDELDRASAMEMEVTHNTILEIQAKCRPVQLARDDGSFEFTDCEDCGNEIGEQRLRVAIQNHLCVFCATQREVINKRRST